jgi:hypothetical protein
LPENKRCPECGGLLVEDAWETVKTNDDGSYTIDAFLAYKCIQRCGYYIPIDRKDQP